jgi:ABC-2 type transport system permease protein
VNVLRVAWVYFRIGVMAELEYRANFFVQLFQSLLNLGGALVELRIIFSYTETLAGWTPPELIALLGVFFLVGGAIRTVIQPSMQRFMEDVRMGTLDFVLTKPEDSQILISVRQIEIWQLTDVVLGIGLVVYALIRLGTAVGLGQAAVFVFTLLCGGAMVYSFWLMLATCTFWFVRIDNILVIFQAMYEAGRWPVGLYPWWLRYTLTFVIPVAFATTVPAQALAGRLAPETLGGATGLAVGLIALSRWFWTFGVRRYSGASA